MVKRPRIASKPAPPQADDWVSKGGLDPEIQHPQQHPEQGKKYPHRISFDMDTPQYKRLKQAAFESDRPMNEILREAVEIWLNASDH